MNTDMSSLLVPSKLKNGTNSPVDFVGQLAAHGNEIGRVAVAIPQECFGIMEDAIDHAWQSGDWVFIEANMKDVVDDMLVGWTAPNSGLFTGEEAVPALAIAELFEDLAKRLRNRIE